MIIIITGASCSGKTTLAKMIKKELRHSAQVMISMTSREPREGEENGVDYHFRTREYMENPITKKLFLESEENYGNLYASFKPFIALDSIYVVDPRGAKFIQDQYQGQCFTVATSVSATDENRLTGERLEVQETEHLEALKLADISIIDAADNLDSFSALMTDLKEKKKNMK